MPVTFNPYPNLILLCFVIFQSCLNYKISHKMKYKLDFYTSYNQFYITSDGGAALTSDSANWTDSAYFDRLFLVTNMLVVRTESYGHIKGELYVLDNSNEKISYNKYDHVVEGGIVIKSGTLQILDCPNSALQFTVKVTPGAYRARIYFLDMAGFDSDEKEGKDHYKIEIWPDTNMERKVLKRYVR